MWMYALLETRPMGKVYEIWQVGVKYIRLQPIFLSNFSNILPIPLTPNIFTPQTHLKATKIGFTHNGFIRIWLQFASFIEKTFEVHK